MYNKTKQGLPQDRECLELNDKRPMPLVQSTMAN